MGAHPRREHRRRRHSVDPDGRLVESIVDQVHAAPWSGDMVHVRARGMHMEMTPNHRVAKLGGVRRASTLARAFAPSSRWSSSMTFRVK